MTHRQHRQEDPPEDPTIVSIHIAPGRRIPMRMAERVSVEAGKGIVGDRYHGTRHRHATIQSLEELAEAGDRHGTAIDPGLTRRNITLSAGRVPRKPGHRWQVGPIELEVVRDAAPCKLLDDTLGRDVRLALSRRAGVVCRVLSDGDWAIGDRATLEIESPDEDS
jgi:MOSC domain-containing protein YiiM